MKKIAVPAFAALVMSTSFAWAWNDVTGTIRNINAQSHEIILDNGKTYTLQGDVALGTFKVGDKVMVSTEVQNGKNMINKLSKAG